jgi:transcriptional regulator with XRE-family HTH domain
VSKSYLSRTELGAIKLPSVEVRRRIADVLGMRHIDLLVLAGELSPDEIAGAGAARNPFPASDPRHEVIERLLADDALLETVLSLIAFADRERGVHNRK